MKSALALIAASVISTVAAAVGSSAGQALLKGRIAVPAVHTNNSLGLRDTTRVDNRPPGYLPCENKPGQYAPPGYYCCDNRDISCAIGRWCMPEPVPQDMACCKNGKKCDGITGTTTTVVTIGTSTRVLVDLETEVEWTGSWFAYAYAWCAVWGPKGRRINAPSGAATAMATITFEPGVKAVAISIVASNESLYPWTLAAGDWDEDVSARASASVGPDGSVSASAECRWTNKFYLMDRAIGLPQNNPLVLEVKQDLGTLYDNSNPDAWVQINAIQAFASVEDMNAEVSGSLSLGAPAPTATATDTVSIFGLGGPAPTSTANPTRVPIPTSADDQSNAPKAGNMPSGTEYIVPSPILAVLGLALLLFV